MRLPALFGLILAAFAAPPAHADGPVLVELFASKNCRSCPAAYKAMDELEAQRDDVLVLTWPVDYWDYLGSKEKMALPESKDRQRGYVERFSLRGPYTPQAVFNGNEQAPGNKAGKVGNALGKTMSRAGGYRSPGLRIGLHADRSGSRFRPRPCRHGCALITRR